MAITKLFIKKSVVVNLGDYQNAKVEIGLEHTLEEGQMVEDAYALTSPMLRNLMLVELAGALRNRGSYYRRDIFRALGLTIEEIHALDAEWEAAAKAEREEESQTPEPVPLSYFNHEDTDDYRDGEDDDRDPDGIPF